jgi:hypothetical protein
MSTTVAAALMQGGLIFGLLALGKLHLNVNSELLDFVEMIEFPTRIVGFFLGFVVQ